MLVTYALIAPSRGLFRRHEDGLRWRGLSNKGTVISKPGLQRRYQTAWPVQNMQGQHFGHALGPDDDQWLVRI